MLGLIGVAVPGRASFSYYNGTSGNTQFNNAVALAGWTLSPSEGIGAGFGTLVTPADHEYDDTATGAKFFSFLSNGTTSDKFSISLPPLTTHNSGDLIEITLPANVFAFRATIGFISAPAATVCFEAASSFSSTCSGNQTSALTLGSPMFFGVTSTTAFNTIWIGESNADSFTPEYQITGFADATGVGMPETGSMLLLGGGLVAIGLIRLRRRRPRRAGPSSRY